MGSPVDHEAVTAIGQREQAAGGPAGDVRVDGDPRRVAADLAIPLWRFPDSTLVRTRLLLPVAVISRPSFPLAAAPLNANRPANELNVVNPPNR